MNVLDDGHLSDTNESDSWLVAVDDDPTGCQTVSGVPILLTWDQATLSRAASRSAPVTFILTNSRSLERHEAVQINHEVGTALKAAADANGKHLRLVSRSDSTLRGHFPDEMTALAQGAGLDVDAVIVCPAFFEAGRYTAGGIHWVRHDAELIPACRTEFARDADFGFTELRLTDWIDNRLKGAAPAIEVGSTDLEQDDVQQLRQILMAVHGGQAVAINATNYTALHRLVDALEDAEHAGRQFIYRSGPSLVRALARLDEPQLVRFVTDRDRHGLIVVGSHTERTNRQVTALLESEADIVEIELRVADILDDHQRDTHLQDVIKSASERLRESDVVLRTSRDRIAGADASGLAVGKTISAALVAAVRTVAASTPPGWVVSKGGITSHDLLTDAFAVNEALVAGQALPGIIPVLNITDPDRPRRSWPFVIFPGNVGSDSSLLDVVQRIRHPDDPPPRRA